MPRASANKGAEIPRRQSPRGPLQLRTTSSNSDSSHHRAIPNKSPQLGGRRSPQSIQSEPVQKKLGTRIADLESQLGQAQEELKHLKKELVNAETAKREAQEKLKKKSTRKRNVLGPPRTDREVNELSKIEARSGPSEDDPEEIQQETDVFEVPMEEKVTVEHKTGNENSELAKELDKKNQDSESSELTEPEKQQTLNELALGDNEISLLKGKLEEKENELEEANKETEQLKKQISEVNKAISSAQVREKEMAQKLNQMEEELKESCESGEKLNEKLEVVERAKESLEAEMKMLRIQTEQWRKAADAAAAVLAGGPEMNHGKTPGRCGSMDKHFGPAFEIPGGYTGFVGSLGNADDVDDGSGGRRKGSGIRMFGDLWKKKGQK